MRLRQGIKSATTPWALLLLVTVFLAAPNLVEAAALERALNHFMAGQAGPLWLRGANVQSEVSIPLPARWRARDLKLNLVYRNSVNLLREHSQLRVELNGLVIAQFPLDPNRPEGRATIRLPTDLLQSGYNQLRFAAAQHTLVGQCEDPAAPELWTQIDTQQSTLQLEYERLPVATQLSRINEIFDRHHWEAGRARIPMTQAKPDEQLLHWGALVTQAAALHLQYVPLQISFGPRLQARTELGKTGQFPQLDSTALGDNDAVLIGTRDQLSPLLGASWASKVEEGYLAIFPRDDDPTLALLIVSGRNEAEVSRAATLLGLLDMAFPDAGETLISKLSVPLLPPNSGPRYLPTATGVAFAQLGVPTTTLRSPLHLAMRVDMGAANASSNAARSALSVEFWAASSGLYAGGTPRGALSLHFSYGAGLRRDSVLNILLNGKLVKGISLDNFQGGDFNAYKVEFPLNLVQAGRNKLELVPIMVPSVTDYCDLRQGENLLMTIHDDSSLQLPPASALARLPDLRLLTQAGFPLLRDPQGKELAVRIIGDAPESIAAAWTLLARLAQITTIPLHQALIGFNPEAKDRDMILVGPLASLDPALVKAMPITFGDTSSQVHYPLPTTIARSETNEGWLEQWLAWVESWFRPKQPEGAMEIRTAQAELRGKSLDRYGAIAAFQSPSQSGRSVVLLTAREPTLLLERAWQLVQPSYWYNLRGAVGLWSDRPESLRWQDAETHYTVGDGSTESRLSHYFTYYPWALLITAFLLFLGLVLLLLASLRRFKRRHHPEIEHEG